MFRTLATVLMITVLDVFSASACGWETSVHSPAASFGGHIVEQLRSQGATGLQEVLRKYDELHTHVNTTTDSEKLVLLKKKLRRCEELADQVAGQYHATTSRLYWYTDLELAKRQAVAEGKPILSLRMLGKLTDEYSCANSRFLRTSLYANQEISDALRDRFVLHWQSVRPVPKVTIDFGDGRKLMRTITGNSAHYVLSAAGKPLDALPGLYSPHEFLAWLGRIEELASEYSNEAEAGKPGTIKTYHTERRAAVMAALLKDLEVAAPQYLNLQRVRAGVEFFDRQPYEQVWQRIAKLRSDNVHLDEPSIALIRKENPNAIQAGAAAVTKRVVEDPILRLVRHFEKFIALDTVRNEYQLHRKIHDWFAAGATWDDVDSLNERVYSELFLTPSSDPWLGLVPPDAYTALENGGLSIIAPR